MHVLYSELSALYGAALREKFGETPGVVGVGRSTKAEFGDLQISGAMQLAKPLKKPPREIAQVIAGAVEKHPAIERVEIAGPGFVNLHLRDAWLAEHAGAGLELRDLGRGQTVVIDYSSPNVAKPMHIAHIRSTIIGDAIKRSLRAVGYTVIADNHLGDWGTQFGKLIVAWRKWLDADAFAKDPVAELLRLYIKFIDEEKGQRGILPQAANADGEESDDEPAVENAPPLLREARAELVKLQQGDPENVALWKKFVDVSKQEFNRVYKRLGVAFDVELGESFYNDRLAATVEELVKRGIAEESRGAIVVFFRKPDGTDELPPFLIRKADGGYNYGTTDVAGLFYRLETWRPARILIVTDERQQLHFKQLFATAHRLGLDEQVKLEHVPFGLMRLPEGTISTREGKLIHLEALLDEAERRAYEIARAKAAESEEPLSEAELREVARVVGLGAVKYNDLSKERTTTVTFTWDKALALTGNTAPYLQYAYARIRSILRKAGAGPIGPVAALAPSERELVKRLLWFPDGVEQVTRARPHLLAEYLFELATAFSTFYAEHPVLKAEPAERASRLKLCELTAETLSRGLAILGIDVLERM
ncbi:MAG TPA: arginine--tRNA ligase [Polyangia bacterium]|nr:arginine--tRNA ligase [Polyangia bacterium]